MGSTARTWTSSPRPLSPWPRMFVVGPIALDALKALEDVRAIRHQPRGLLDWHTVDFRHHPTHAEVEVSKTCPRELWRESK